MQHKSLVLLIVVAFCFAKSFSYQQRSTYSPVQQSYLSRNNQHYYTQKADYTGAGVEGPEDGDEVTGGNDEEDTGGNNEEDTGGNNDGNAGGNSDPGAGGGATGGATDNALPQATNTENPEVDTSAQNADAERKQYDGGEAATLPEYALKTFAPTYSEVKATEIGAHKKEPVGKYTFKNGYDPVYNQMLNGPLNLYIAQMQAKLMNNDIEFVPLNSEIPILDPTAGSTPNDGAGSTQNEGDSNGSTQNEGDSNGSTQNEGDNNAEQKKEDGVGEINGGDLYTSIADYFGASDGMQAEPTAINYHDAPFRFVNDATTKDITGLKQSLDSLTTELMTDARNAKPLVLTNAEDEKAIIENSKKTKADSKIAKKLQEQQQAVLRTGDPFEISILHKINTKIRKIQDAVTRHEIGSQQELPAQTVVLQNLVSSVKALRKQAEKQYQEQPMRTQAKDERYLHKMEKLLKKMTELMNDRSLTPKQFNHLSELYRDKLNLLRLKCK